MPLDRYETDVSRVGGAAREARAWVRGLDAVMVPVEEDACVVFAYESYTAWTDVTPDGTHAEARTHDSPL